MHNQETFDTLKNATLTKQLNLDQAQSSCNMTLTDPEFSSYYEEKWAQDTSQTAKKANGGGIKTLSDFKMKDLAGETTLLLQQEKKTKERNEELKSRAKTKGTLKLAVPNESQVYVKHLKMMRNLYPQNYSTK